MQVKLLAICSFMFCVSLCTSSDVIDNNGYLLYCPCTGQFGDQTQHLLNALAFSKGLNRTLVVPPWIIYTMIGSSNHVAYDEWFSLPHLRKYHKVIPMKSFLNNTAPDLWPYNARTGLCRIFMKGTNACEMEYSNPFGTFWKMKNVTFTDYKLHAYDLWDTLGNTRQARSHWMKMYPATDAPILALRKPPGKEIATTSTIEKLQQYIEFSPKLMKSVSKLLEQQNVDLNKTVAVQILSENYLDYVCSFNESFLYGSFFSSSQCTGLNQKANKRPLNFTYEMCKPSQQGIIDYIYNYVNMTKATTLFISTDKEDHRVQKIKKELNKLFEDKITIWVRANCHDDLQHEFIKDLVIMSKVKNFIGNCVDAYSSFVRRQRKVYKKPYAFFASTTKYLA